MNVFATAAAIARASFEVLRAHKRLVLFPVLSLATTLTLVVSFMPLPPHTAGDGMTLALLFVALHVTVRFYDAGLTAEALRSLRGQSVSVSGGLSLALARLPAIVTLGVIDSTVGYSIGRLRKSGLSRFAHIVVGTYWQLSTYLALPVLVAERKNGYQCLVRSGQLFRRTWGETTLSEIGLRVLAVNAALAILLVAFVIGHILDEPLAIVLAVVLLVGVAVVMSALEAIYRAALYLYAAEGSTPSEFGTGAMKQVWRSASDVRATDDDDHSAPPPL